jgi:YD repeat-containing protein
MSRIEKARWLGLAAAAGLMAAGSPALADDICPGAKPIGASFTIPDAQGMPGGCATTFEEGKVTLSGRLVGDARDIYTSTTYLYDQHGDILGETYSTGQTVYFGPNQKPTSTITDHLGHSVYYHYNPAGLVDTAQDTQGSVSYTYNSQQQLYQAMDLYGRWGDFTYNSSGLMDFSETFTGPITSTTYTYNSNQLSKSVTSGLTTTYAYPGLPQSVITRPDGSYMSFYYDAFGRLMFAYDSAGAGRTIEYGYGYDGSDHRPLWAKDLALGLTTTFTYDAVGAQLTIRVTDPGGAVTTSVYDDGALVGETDPLGNRYRYFYDSQDRLVKEADPGGAWTAFSYTTAAVPEPGAWSLMLAGIGALGARARRRRSSAATA